MSRLRNKDGNWTKEALIDDKHISDILIPEIKRLISKGYNDSEVLYLIVENLPLNILRARREIRRMRVVDNE